MAPPNSYICCGCNKTFDYRPMFANEAAVLGIRCPNCRSLNTTKISRPPVQVETPPPENVKPEPITSGFSPMDAYRDTRPTIDERVMLGYVPDRYQEVGTDSSTSSDKWRRHNKLDTWNISLNLVLIFLIVGLVGIGGYFLGQTLVTGFAPFFIQSSTQSATISGTPMSLVQGNTLKLNNGTTFTCVSATCDCIVGSSVSCGGTMSVLERCPQGICLTNDTTTSMTNEEFSCGGNSCEYKPGNYNGTYVYGQTTLNTASTTTEDPANIFDAGMSANQTIALNAIFEQVDPILTVIPIVVGAVLILSVLFFMVGGGRRWEG
jgi:DNA-directed RNA polymerase subunit RPC12/RpoP